MSPSSRSTPLHRSAPGGPACAQAATSAANPLRDATRRAPPPSPVPDIARRRAILALAVVLTTALGVGLWLVVTAGTMHPLLIAATAALLGVKLAWLSLYGWSALIGWWRLWRDPALRQPFDGRPVAPDGTTAIIVPIFHEPVDEWSARLSWMQRDLDARGLAPHFHWYVLSDSEDPSLVDAETRTIARLRAGAFARGALTYRRRTDRRDRKPGNVMDFVDRFGDRHRYMIVLDADSLMSAPRLLALEAAIDAAPDTAIIQTVPQFFDVSTRWARLLAVPARLFGPMLAAGSDWWQGREANFWGHNAIVRIAAFREHARLAPIPGGGPFSGAIRSHDFVEAAQLRRAGWACRLDPRPGGSYEQLPPDPLRFLQRERRWMHGNLQHLKLLFGRDWHPMSRLHFAIGALGYLIAPLWLMFVLLAVGAHASLTETLAQHADELIVTAGGATNAARGLDWAAWFEASRWPIALLALVVLLLLLPRTLALFTPDWIKDPERLGPFATDPGDSVRARLDRDADAYRTPAAVQLAREVGWMALVAPILMLWHVGFLLAISLGRVPDWGAQARDLDSRAPCDNARVQWQVAAVGLGSVVAVVVTPISLWLLPLAMPAMLAPLIAAWLARRPDGHDRPGGDGDATRCFGARRLDARAS